MVGTVGGGSYGIGQWVVAAVVGTLGGGSCGRDTGWWQLWSGGSFGGDSGWWVWWQLWLSGHGSERVDKTGNIEQ